MVRTWYPKVDDIINYNKEMVANFRATKAEKHEVYSRIKISKAIQSSRAKKGDVEDKAIVLMRRLNQSHPFASANRRTAHYALNSMLYCNKRYLVAMKHGKRAGIQQQIRDRCLTHKQIREKYNL